jgi:two-component system CheB/CheR fusion protein
MAFVLVLHLDARKESAIASVLRKRTKLEVSVAPDGARLRPNAVYIAPPGKELRLDRGRFRLDAREKGKDHAGVVDRFFASLALDLKQQATALLLSGAGTDGTRGLEAVRRAGGFTLAQDVHSSEYPGMPGSAAAANVVDRVLRVEDVFAVLRERFAANRQTRQGSPASVTRSLPRPKTVLGRLRQELTLTKGQLGDAFEQLAIVREELQSSNEELRSSNEELQSSNEGLESSREELQSMNEELAVVNSQLLEKVAEVTQASNDVANLLTSSDIATLLLDSELRVSRYTLAATAIFALKPSDVGRPIAELRMLAAYPRFLEDARSVVLGAAQVETQVRSTEERVFMARLAPYRTQDGRAGGVVATFVDVTSLDVARNALRDNAEQLRALVDHVAVGIALTDLRGRVIDVNPALSTMLGWEREALIGRSFNRHVHTEGGQVVQQMHRDLLAGRRQHYDVEDRYVRADATVLWARVSVSLIQTAGAARARVVYVIQDVSDAKSSEKKLRAQEGLARLGEMAAAIAHEVRSPLVAILGAVDVLATRIPQGMTEQRVVGEIRQRISSVDALVSELLLFARPKELAFSRLPLMRLLRETGALLQSSGDLGEVELLILGEEQDTDVLGDVELLKSVFVNLASNAAQAMNGRGELRIEMLADVDTIRVAFADTGPGVPDAVAHRIFEPFFTTRNRGIGLGLSLAKRIIEAHGGDLELVASAGRGATLSITLPKAGSSAA